MGFRSRAPRDRRRPLDTADVGDGRRARGAWGLVRRPRTVPRDPVDAPVEEQALARRGRILGTVPPRGIRSAAQAHHVPRRRGARAPLRRRRDRRGTVRAPRRRRGRHHDAPRAVRARRRPPGGPCTPGGLLHGVRPRRDAPGRPRRSRLRRRPARLRLDPILRALARRSRLAHRLGKRAPRRREDAAPPLRRLGARDRGGRRRRLSPAPARARGTARSRRGAPRVRVVRTGIPVELLLAGTQRPLDVFTLPSSTTTTLPLVLAGTGLRLHRAARMPGVGAVS